MFFSPWASESTTEEHVIEFNQKMDELPFFSRSMYKVAKGAFKAKSSPFGWARTAGRWIGGFMISKAVKRRFPNLPDEEIRAFTEYMHQIIMMRGSSEFGFGLMFPDLMYSDKAISNFIEEYKEHGIEISFYYGTHDWMDTKFNGENISQQLTDRGEKVYIIHDAGHHIYFCNPDEAVDSIIDDFENSEVVNMTRFLSD